MNVAKNDERHERINSLREAALDSVLLERDDGNLVKPAKWTSHCALGICESNGRFGMLRRSYQLLLVIVGFEYDGF